MIPVWLHDLSLACLLAGAVCALVILADLVRNPQPMRIMNVVWPVKALFGTIVVLWQYFCYGRANAPDRQTPFPIAVANGALHCGAGCTLGDIAAEWLIVFAPPVAVWFGWRGWFHDRIFATWIVDFLFAYAFGVAFQYFAIAPMRNLSFGKALWAAVKADTLSLTAWQVGMYGFMALAKFYLFGVLLGAALMTNSVEFWFMMQIAMLFGFATAYPMNWQLIRAGIKERM
jgi:hypothetical protein